MNRKWRFNFFYHINNKKRNVCVFIWWKNLRYTAYIINYTNEKQNLFLLPFLVLNSSLEVWRQNILSLHQGMCKFKNMCNLLYKQWIKYHYLNTMQVSTLSTFHNFLSKQSYVWVFRCFIGKTVPQSQLWVSKDRSCLVNNVF